MKLSIKLLGLAMVSAFVLLAFTPGGSTRPQVASAACTPGGNLVVNIVDQNGTKISSSGSVVHFVPNPTTGAGSRNVTDNSGTDDSGVTGRVAQNAACTGSYTVTLSSIPSTIRDRCDITGDSDSGDVAATGTTTLELQVDCNGGRFNNGRDCLDSRGIRIDCRLGCFDTFGRRFDCQQPFIFGAPSLISLQSPAGMPCGTTSTVSALVRGSDGNAVANGTLVSFSSTGGAFANQLMPTINGLASVGFTAPNVNGPVVLTGFAGGFSTQTTILISCVTTPAPAPVTVVQAPAPQPVQIIQAPPVVALPRTGEGAGAVESNSGSSPLLPIGGGLVIIAALGIAAYLRTSTSRAS